MLSLSRIYQLSGRLSRRIHHTTLEVGDFCAKVLKDLMTEMVQRYFGESAGCGLIDDE